MKRRRLPRLPMEEYRGRTAVHWIYSMEGRKTGWLTPGFHSRYREVLIHACARYSCAAPVYCLMPDHQHVVLWGLGEDADLYLASKFIRKHTAAALAPFKYQEQAYDHVLTDEKRDSGKFEQACWYVAENPVRAGFCESAKGHLLSGAVIPGYPDVNIHSAGYWELFWKISAKFDK